MKKCCLCAIAPLLVAVAILLIAPAAPAQTQPASQPNFTISVGIFPTTFSTSSRLSTAENEGTEVDLEDELGFDNSASNVRVEGLWRFRPKHRLEFGYTSWRRTTEKEIDEQIQWGDLLFNVGANVKGVNNAQFIKLAYRYSLMKSDTTEVDVSAGFDTIWNKTTLSGEATITDDQGHEVTGQAEKRNDFVAPAPLFGVSVTHLFTPAVAGRLSTEYFQLTYNETTGKVLDARGSVDWYFGDRWGAGLGYSWVGYKVERERFDVQYDFSGPVLYFSYRR